MKWISQLKAGLFSAMKEDLLQAKEEIVSSTAETIHSEVEPYLERLERLEESLNEILRLIRPISVFSGRLNNLVDRFRNAGKEDPSN